jgi:cytochrome P450
MLLVNDATKLPLVYSRNADKDKFYISGSFGKEEGIFNVQDSTIHAKHRKIAAAPYSSSIIRKLEPLIDEQIKHWMAKLHDNFAVPGESFEFARWAVYLAYDVISSVAFGAPFGFVEQGKDVGGLIQGSHDGLLLFGIMSRLFPSQNGSRSRSCSASLLPTRSKRMVLERS